MKFNTIRFWRATIAGITLGIFCVASPADAKVQRGARQIQLVKKDTSRPLRDIAPAPRPAGVNFIRENPQFIEKAPFRPDGAMQTSTSVSSNAPTTISQFEGVGEGLGGYNAIYVPPDTNGDVDGSYFVQTVNVDLAVFSKSTGSAVLGPVSINTLWDGFGGDCEFTNDGDPIVTYDQFTGRWIISQFAATNTPYLECVAVSTTSNPTGTYHRYAYSFGSDFPDYPKVGVWPTEDAYFITFNMFAPSYLEARVCAFQTSKLIAGSANTMQCFATPTASLLAADLDGTTLPAAGTDGYAVARSGSGLVSWRINLDWNNSSNSTFSGPTTVSGVASYSNACSGGGTCITQPKPAAKLDSLGSRLMHRAAYRIVGGQASLVLNHSVTTSFVSGRKTTTSAGVRWYELRPSGSALSVHQQGTFAPDATFRWMGSIAMDKLGNIGLGYSASSGTLYPSIRYTGRLASDLLNTMQTEATIINGSGSQQQYTRWGDYSSLAPDPDGCRLWYTTEYLAEKGSFNWHTRIASFKFSNCN